MIVTEINGETFMVHPEYTSFTSNDYIVMAINNTNKTIIGGTKRTYHEFKGDDKKYIQATISSYNGTFFDVFGYRGKTHLTSGEKKEGFTEADPKTSYSIWDTRKNKILILICYEICFPEDYYHLIGGDIDLIVHLVGYPMYDRHQYKAWYALQKALVKHFNVPLISSCGGNSDDPMNLTHIITPKMLNDVDQMGNFTERRIY